MARSISAIYQELLNSKASKPELDGLTSNSIYSIWQNIYYIIAIGISMHEQYFDLFKNDLEYIKSTSNPQTALYYNDKAVNYFQYSPGSTSGDGVLAIGNDLVPFYPVIDPTKRIIKYASTKQTAGQRQVNIKVAKDDGSGNPIPLETDELAAFISFMADLGGSYINILSLPADILNLNMNIYYNAQFGTATVLDNVQIAIKNYLENLFETSFDGTIHLSAIVDAIQSVKGVSDVLINSASGQPSGQVPLIFNRIYSTSAGYASLDLTNSTINMIVE